MHQIAEFFKKNPGEHVFAAKLAPTYLIIKVFLASQRK